MKPSPGPWRWAPNAEESADAKLVDSSGEDVAVGAGGTYETDDGCFIDVAKDNAALIALAPEMREMLLKFGWTLDNPSGTCGWCGVLAAVHRPCVFSALLDRIR